MLNKLDVFANNALGPFEEKRELVVVVLLANRLGVDWETAELSNSLGFSSALVTTSAAFGGLGGTRFKGLDSTC